MCHVLARILEKLNYSRVLAVLLLILIGAYLILFEIATTISEGYLLDTMPLNK